MTLYRCGLCSTTSLNRKEIEEHFDSHFAANQEGNPSAPRPETTTAAAATISSSTTVTSATAPSSIAARTPSPPPAPATASPSPASASSESSATPPPATTTSTSAPAQKRRKRGRKRASSDRATRKRGHEYVCYDCDIRHQDFYCLRRHYYQKQEKGEGHASGFDMSRMQVFAPRGKEKRLVYNPGPQLVDYIPN